MKKLFLLITLASVIFSCKKNSTPQTEDPCKPKPANITGTYKKMAVKYKASSTAAEQDWFSGLQDCEKDNTYELKPDNTVVVSEGTETCPGPPPPTGISMWSLSNNNMVFALDAVYDIVSFDCTTLVVVEKDLLVAGDTRTVTFVKQ